ncbi:MAG: right-handed parallel beta-helix repeat-containing protein [Planctomycetota bacterium]
MTFVVCLIAAWAAASVTLATPSEPQADAAADTPQRVVVAQDGSGDVNGDDQRALQAAVDRLGPGGGTVVVRPGRYWSRASLRVGSGVRLEGEPGALLQLPSPKRVTVAAAAGARRLVLSDTEGIAPDTALQLVPPEDQTTFDGTSEMISFVLIAAVDEEGVDLSEPLPYAIPPRSRFGYPFKMIWASRADDVSITGLAFDGGMREDLPMPGHHQRSAIWIDAHFSKREGPIHEPVARASVRACHFTNFYGRGVAFYNAVDAEVVACRFRNINDEAIDFDHWCFRCRATGNEISNALWGIAINDASDCVVEHNFLRDCDVGITIWWLPAVPPEGLNENNVVRGNFVYGSREALTVLRNARRNHLLENVLQGAFHVVEDDNLIERNTLVEADR